MRVPATNKNYANIASGILLSSLFQRVNSVSALKDLGSSRSPVTGRWRPEIPWAARPAVVAVANPAKFVTAT
ncbi:MAG TPA: hypothetical protein VMV11_06250 [Acidimicrobiales bacterium]|nr:hypothetical protein [Acidimicrobiales bacterium]